MLIKEIIFEAKPQTPKPRNFVAKAAQTVAKGAGAHKDKKRAEKQGDVKHKKQLMPMEDATAGATSAANVAIGPVYKNKTAKTAKNKDGTAKNALDIPGTNLITGGSIKRR